jgi:hypothetical protein
MNAVVNRPHSILLFVYFSFDLFKFNYFYLRSFNGWFFMRSFGPLGATEGQLTGS